MTRLPLLIALAALVLLPASAAAKAPVCDRDTIQQALISAGKLTEEGVMRAPFESSLPGAVAGALARWAAMPGFRAIRTPVAAD